MNVVRSMAEESRAIVTRCQARWAFLGVLALSIDRLAKTVAAALKATDYIYWFCDFDPAFLQEIKDATEAGVQFMFGWPPVIQEATWHIRDIDMAAVSARGKKWEEMLNRYTGREFRLITDGEELTGTTKRFYSFGPGERKVGLTDRSSTGFFSDANGIQNMDWIGVCSDVLPGKKARLTISDGAIVKSEGELGEMFWKTLQAINDPNIYKMAELAIGMNPYTRIGVSALGPPNLPMTVPPYHEVRMSQGVVHLAFGDSGGRFEPGVAAKLHIDTASFKPTLYVAGTKYVEDARLLY